MRSSRWCWAVVLVVAGGCLGCGQESPSPAGTGAREAALGYFEALAQKEWAQTYAKLHSQSRGRYSLEQFNRLAQSYRGGLGFEPSAVYVRACEEQGSKAIAHAVWTGQSASRLRQYKDAVELRREGGTWGIVLPANFGRSRGSR
jgi:hypothetical protein